MDRLEAHRAYYAKLVTASAGVPPTDRLVAAFASVPRERFVGPGPWRVFTAGGYVATPDDPACLYQDVVVALKSEAQINNGQPTLHAACLAALRVQPGEAIVHVGAGSGYYTAILAELVGPAGSVVAYELDADLAQRASENLAGYPTSSFTTDRGRKDHCQKPMSSMSAQVPPIRWMSGSTRCAREDGCCFHSPPPSAPAPCCW